MGLYPFNPNAGHRIQGEAGTTPPARAFIAHYNQAPRVAAATRNHAAVTLATAFSALTSAASGDILDDAVSTVLEVDDVANVAVGDVVKDAAVAELCLVTAKDADAKTLTLQRGFAGTTAAAHAGAATWNQYGEYLTTGWTQPDVPRALSTTCNEADMDGNVYIIGTDAAGAALIEAIACDGAGDLLALGAKAFRSITGAVFPVRKDADETISVGEQNVFGLTHKLDAATRLLVKNFDKATDAGSLAVSATVLASNLYTCAGTPNAAKRLELWYLVN